MKPTSRTLSENESRIVLDLEWHGKKTVSLGEIREALQTSDAYARFLAHKLVAKGWLERLRPGFYQLIPAERGPEGVPDFNPLAAGSALVEPYFYSYGTACTHHGLTEQVFSEVYVAHTKRRRPVTIHDKRYVFVHITESRFFGFTTIDVLGSRVEMATVERTILDAIDRPNCAGGLAEVSRMIRRVGPRMEWSKIVDLLQQWDESALVQRLGYFLDLQKIELPKKIRSALLRLVPSNSKIFLGSRGEWGTKGDLIHPWNILQNIPTDVLLEKGETGRRKIVFSGRSNRR